MLQGSILHTGEIIEKEKSDETGRFTDVSVCETLSGRKRYVITDDNKDTRLFIWNNISDIKPLAASVKIK